MGIDRETKLRTVSITLDDSPKYLKELREQADEDGQNDCLDKGDCKKLSLVTDKHSFDMGEFYLEEDEEGAYFHIDGSMISSNGKSRLYFDIPLSDIILVDVINHSIKKLNKLKTAMEALK